MKEICESFGKGKGGPWDCYKAWDFTGWEADRVVGVATGGGTFLEMATRAKTQLILILVEPEGGKHFYAEHQQYFQDAADNGLVQLLASQQSGNESETQLKPML